MFVEFLEAVNMDDLQNEPMVAVDEETLKSNPKENKELINEKIQGRKPD